jgi:hypothetical protein
MILWGDGIGWATGRISLRPQWSSDRLQAVVVLPLWIPFLVAAIPSALFWRRDHVLTKRARAGRCPACNYDRHGLTADAKCPECGAVPPSGSVRCGGG